MPRIYSRNCDLCSTYYRKQNKRFCSNKCRGINAREFKHSEESKRIISEKHVGSRNPMWKGDGVGLIALHNWVRRRFVKPSSCGNCDVETTKLDLANVSQKYLRDLTDWEYLCRKCHMVKDGRINNLKQYSK